MLPFFTFQTPIFGQVQRNIAEILGVFGFPSLAG